VALNDSWVKKDLSPEQENIGLEEERRRAFMEESGIDGTDAIKLRKSMLSADEAIIAKQEQLEEIRIRKSRKPDWDEFVDAKRRWGYALHSSEVLLRLHRLIPNLYVDDGMVRNTLSLYLWDRTQPFEAKVGGTVFLTWIQKDWGPEYEIDLPNDVGVAVRQIRGWRTALLHLICRRDVKTFQPKSIITEEQATEAFGFPSNGPTASEFRRQLWHFRNTSPERARLEYQLMQAANKYRGVK
jgi:hypothetical protein